MTEVAVRVSADADLLARTVAERLLVRVKDAQSERGFAAVVLTGGRIAARIYEAVLDTPARAAVDWTRVDVWWGDERFLPAGDPDRNETQARGTFLDALPLDPARIHPMPALSAAMTDPEAAAAAYAIELAASARPGTARLPHLDVVLLGVGEDGHVASIFPEHPAAYETRPVTGVRGSPKPPPNRVSLTLPAINTAAEVWLIAAGPEKASVIGAALTGGPGPVQLPASGVRGVERTLWLLDRTAAAEVPPSLRSLR
jgi:6-phosphogluconolactonase